MKWQPEIATVKAFAKRGLAIYYNLHNSPLISLRDSKVFAWPGFMKFDGGVYNPGAISLDGEIILLARAERFSEKERLGDRAKYLSSCSALLFRYSNSMILKKTKALSLENYPTNRLLRSHDFRLFKFRTFTFVNHTLVDTSSWAGTPFSEWQKQNMEEIVAIAQLDLSRCCLKFKGIPRVDFTFKRREKNFGFFEHSDNLYLIYSVSPYILLEAIDWENLCFRTVINRKVNIRSLGSSNRLLSLSTNPIHYDDKHYLILVHRKDRFYVCAHWGIIISKESLLPVKITARPLFRGTTSKGALTSIVYVMSVLSFGDRFRFFLGEGDLYSSYIDITKRELDQAFIPISSDSIS